MMYCPHCECPVTYDDKTRKICPTCGKDPNTQPPLKRTTRESFYSEVVSLRFPGCAFDESQQMAASRLVQFETSRMILAWRMSQIFAYFCEGAARAAATLGAALTNFPKRR